MQGPESLEPWGHQDSLPCCLSLISLCTGLTPLTRQALSTQGGSSCHWPNIPPCIFTAANPRGREGNFPTSTWEKPRGASQLVMWPLGTNHRAQDVHQDLPVTDSPNRTTRCWGGGHLRKGRGAVPKRTCVEYSKPQAPENHISCDGVNSPESPVPKGPETSQGQ